MYSQHKSTLDLVIRYKIQMNVTVMCVSIKSRFSNIVLFNSYCEMILKRRFIWYRDQWNWFSFESSSVKNIIILTKCLNKTNKFTVYFEWPRPRWGMSVLFLGLHGEKMNSNHFWNEWMQIRLFYSFVHILLFKYLQQIRRIFDYLRFKIHTINAISSLI